MTPDRPDAPRRDAGVEGMTEMALTCIDSLIPHAMMVIDIRTVARAIAHLLTTVGAQARAAERERCLGIVLAKAHTERCADDTLQGAYNAAPFEALADLIREAFPTDAPGGGR